MNFKSLALICAWLLTVGTIAHAIQSGTTGTEKSFQNSAVKIGLAEMVNGTATASSGAATLNAGSGIITSEALTTAAGADYTLTLTNASVAAADIVLASVQNGSNTTVEPAVTTVAPAAGSVVILVRNLHASSTLNGTIKISFVVIKTSAINAD